MSTLSPRHPRRKQAVPTPPQRTKNEARMIKIMNEKGAKGFRILRSAEKGQKQYRRPSGLVASGGHGR